ncbi:MAG: hypothetical protein ACE5HM_07490 [Acidiferrobacterales bacterium]
MIWWLWVPVTIVAALVLWRWLKSPVLHSHQSFDELSEFVDVFVLRFATGSVLTIDFDARPGFFQFALADDCALEQVLEFGLPEVDWSSQTFLRVMETLQEDGFSPNTNSQCTGETVQRFLRVRICGSRRSLVSQAMRLLAVVRDAMDLSDDQSYTVSVTGQQNVRSRVELDRRILSLRSTDPITKWLQRRARRRIGA